MKTKPTRLKITVTCVVEYDATPEYYPEGTTPEDMLAIEIKNAEYDTFLFMESDNAIWAFTGEVLK